MGMQVSIGLGEIQCEWVPGTMNQVWVRTTEDEIKVSVDQLQNLAGKDAVHELYLKGLISLPRTSCLKEALAKIHP